MYLKPIKLTVLFVLSVFSAQPCAQDLFSEKSFRLGYYTKSFQDHSFEDLEVAIKMLSEEIGKQEGILTTITIFDDLSNMRDAFARGEINSALTTSADLVENFDNALFAENGFKFIKSREAFDTLVVATRKNAGADEIGTLQGKRLTLLEFNSNADIYMNIIALRNFNKTAKAGFNILSRVKKSNRAILDLFFGKTDVICVYKSYYKLAIELNPQLAEKIQIIDEVRDLPQAIGLFNINTPMDFRELVISEILKIGDFPRGKQLLEIIKADGVDRASVQDLNQTKSFIAEYQKLVKTIKH